MALYDFAQICLNGHIVNSATETFSHLNREFCKECGAKAITECPNCKSKIEGQIDPKGEWDYFPYDVPSYCPKCGNPYPWIKTKIQAAHDLAQELENISDEEKNILSQSIDDIVKDSPKTTLAATRFKKILIKAGTHAGNAFKDILVDVLSETAKRILWPQ